MHELGLKRCHTLSDFATFGAACGAHGKTVKIELPLKRELNLEGRGESEFSKHLVISRDVPGNRAGDLFAMQFVEILPIGGLHLAANLHQESHLI